MQSGVRQAMPRASWLKVSSTMATELRTPVIAVKGGVLGSGNWWFRQLRLELMGGAGVEVVAVFRRAWDACAVARGESRPVNV